MYVHLVGVGKRKYVKYSKIQIPPNAIGLTKPVSEI
jgi:hypothetical protein